MKALDTAVYWIEYVIRNGLKIASHYLQRSYLDESYIRLTFSPVPYVNKIPENQRSNGEKSKLITQRVEIFVKQLFAFEYTGNK
ncbi:hypothetical protein E2986_12281 [Frieseomelitta varia]|uniref:Uncharacterized protein n=1 Tax=Frieseomelitta varia TaxID=561572 RepID=A0A833W8F6_9HYME|nr:hypothetical protein E2986_12281 [Frieseomelitta varia]